MTADLLQRREALRKRMREMMVVVKRRDPHRMRRQGLVEEADALMAEAEDLHSQWWATVFEEMFRTGVRTISVAEMWRFHQERYDPDCVKMFSRTSEEYKELLAAQFDEHLPEIAVVLKTRYGRNVRVDHIAGTRRFEIVLVNY
jgi:hypothetical protein